MEPLNRLRVLLAENRSDLAALFVYTVVTGLLALALPLAVQVLVNTAAVGIYVQPVLVLALLVLLAMVSVGVLRLVQLSLIERLQQRVFAKTALHLAVCLPRIRLAELSRLDVPERVNRFFEVATVQKALSKLLLDGLAVVLNALGGLLLMAFYSAWLLGFDLLIIAATLVILVGLGRGGLRSSLLESIEKFRVAAWLEEIARCHRNLKTNGAESYAPARADDLVSSWIHARRSHFRVLFRQALANHLFQAAAVAGVLGLGGVLVIKGRLTLGQLAAAEVIIVGLLASLEKLVQQAEQFFDLLTGLEKVGQLTDLPVERTGGEQLPEREEGLRVRLRGVRFSYLPGREVLSGIDLELRAGERAALVGASGSGKSTVAALLCALEEADSGSVELDGMEVRSVALESLWRAVALVNDEDDLFSGSVEENIRVGRDELTYEDIREALETAQLSDEVALLPQGLRTCLTSGGRNLSRGQRQRLRIARGIVDRPRLLILDEAFTGIEERNRQRILDSLFHPSRRWTLLTITQLDEVVVRSGTVHVLRQGTLVESGDVRELASRPVSEFARLFPFLSRVAAGSPELQAGGRPKERGA